jgi:hypothetical protein
MQEVATDIKRGWHWLLLVPSTFTNCWISIRRKLSVTTRVNDFHHAVASFGWRKTAGSSIMYAQIEVSMSLKQANPALLQT